MRDGNFFVNFIYSDLKSLTRGKKLPRSPALRSLCSLVPEEGLEPSSLAACDFESHMVTNFITPAGMSLQKHCSHFV